MEKNRERLEHVNRLHDDSGADIVAGKGCVGVMASNDDDTRRTAGRGPPRGALRLEEQTVDASSIRRAHPGRTAGYRLPDNLEVEAFLGNDAGDIETAAVTADW